VIELGFLGKVGIELGPLLAVQAGDHFRQAVIGLRPEHHVDVGRAPQHFLALCLGDAAGDAEDHGTPAGLARLLHLVDPAELGIDLFRRLLADVTGVQQHHVRVVHGIRQGIAQGGQKPRHTIGVVDVHLAAIGFDMQFFGRRVRHRLPHAPLVAGPENTVQGNVTSGHSYLPAPFFRGTPYNSSLCPTRRMPWSRAMISCRRSISVFWNSMTAPDCTLIR